MAAGASGTAVAGLAAIGAAAGAGVAAAGSLGFAAGNLLNEHTPIQQWIADALPDPAGLNYCGSGY